MNAHAILTSQAGLRLRLPQRCSDEFLRSLSASGDARAFAELYARHHQAIYRYCRSVLRHDEDARDALHNTWASAWSALSRADREVPLRPWLFQIARNESIDILRRRRSHDALDGASAIAAGGVEDSFATRERLAELRTDLDALPERQRSALLLRELCGMGHEEIAAVFAVTPAAAKQSIYEARVALRDAEAGREMTCAAVQRLLSDGDGRVQRGRRLGAHLRSCQDCRAFRAALRRRPGELAAMAPLLPGSLVSAMLARLLPHAGRAAGGHSSATVAAATTAKLGSGLATQLAVGGAVLVTAGAGVAQIQSRHAAKPASSPGSALERGSRALAPAAVARPVSPHGSEGVHAKAGARAAADAPTTVRTAAGDRTAGTSIGASSSSTPSLATPSTPNATPPNAAPGPGHRPAGSRPADTRTSPLSATGPARSHAGAGSGRGSAPAGSRGRAPVVPPSPPDAGPGPRTGGNESHEPPQAGAERGSPSAPPAKQGPDGSGKGDTPARSNAPPTTPVSPGRAGGDSNTGLHPAPST